MRRKPLQIINRQIQQSFLFQDAGEMRIEADEIHVWTISLETENAAELRHFLSAEELKRADRFRLVQDQTQYIVARCCLRLILGKYLDQNPREIDFEYNKFGKPSIKTDDNCRLKFNLSHSRGTAVYALTLDDEIGVDVEFINPDAVDEEIAAHSLTEREFNCFENLPENKRAEMFYKCWTAKEAYAKARGDGLIISPNEIETLLDDSISIYKSEVNFNVAETDSWSFFELSHINGFAASVVVNGTSKKHLQIFAKL